MRLEDLNCISSDPGSKLDSLEAFQANVLTQRSRQGRCMSLPLPDLQPGEAGVVIHYDICNETNTLKEQVIQVQ